MPPNVQDGITSLVGVCDLVESISGTCSALAENDCVISYCRETDDACFTQGKEYGTRCETQATDDNGLVRTVQGVCVGNFENMLKLKKVNIKMRFNLRVYYRHCRLRKSSSIC